MPIVQGTGVSRILANAGAPSAGTDEVQTLTIGGTPTGGTFKLAYDGQVTTAIPWNATNATLIASIDAALEALSNIGTGNMVTAAGTLTAGIGTVTLTFSVGMGKLAVNTITINNNSLTGTSPTLAVAETTPGVTATARGFPKGKVVTDTTNGVLYQNTGTSTAPTWTKVGVET